MEFVVIALMIFFLYKLFSWMPVRQTQEKIEAEKELSPTEWARDVLNSKDQYVILDTETTGLGDNDVIIHFAVMDLNGSMLIDTKVNPQKRRKMSHEAKALHGFSIQDLKGAPTFYEVILQFEQIASAKTILIYNATFHERLYDQSSLEEDVPKYVNFKSIDVKKYYAKWTGDYNVALPGRKNTGIGDCQAVLKIIEEMANLTDNQ